MSSAHLNWLFPLTIAALGATSCSNDFSSSSAGSGGTDAAVSTTGGASGKPNGGGGTVSGGAPSAGAANGGGGTAGKGTGGNGGRGNGGNDADSGAVGTAGKGTGAAPDAGDGGDGASDAGLSPSIPGDGLILWLRADRGVTAQSSLVSRWADQSPSHADAAQDVTRSQPVFVADGINGHPALLFDGTDDLLQLAEGFADFSKGISIFMVMNTSLVGDVCAAVFEASNGEEVDDIYFGPNHDHINYEVFNDANLDVACLADVPQLYSVVQDGTTGEFEVRRDGLFGTLSTFPPPAVVTRKAVYVGKSLYSGCQNFAGRIGEVVVYARALADAETRGVESYLQQRYGCCSK